ncbi:MAG: SPOR domain-containing protein [Armatimonadota bacterium]
MSKHQKEPDGFWFKTLLIIVIVAWIALALGNFTGHYLVNSKFFGKKTQEKQADMPEITVTEPEFEKPEGYGEGSEGRVPKKVVEIQEEKIAEENMPKPEENIDNNKPEEVPSYKIQAGFYSDKKYAQDTVNKLKSLGYSPYISEVTVDGKSGYKVFMGSYKDKEGADKDKEKLKAKGVEVMVVAP